MFKRLADKAQNGPEDYPPTPGSAIVGDVIVIFIAACLLMGLVLSYAIN